MSEKTMSWETILEIIRKKNGKHVYVVETKRVGEEMFLSSKMAKAHYEERKRQNAPGRLISLYLNKDEGLYLEKCESECDSKWTVIDTTKEENLKRIEKALKFHENYFGVTFDKYGTSELVSERLASILN